MFRVSVSSPIPGGYDEPETLSCEIKSDVPQVLTGDIVRWVEQDEAPDQIIAAHYRDDDPSKGADWTRPFCVYPDVAVYNGSGDINDASSYTCQAQ